jgi:outer membrane protein assembly factor BamA
VQWIDDEAAVFVTLTRGPLVKIEFAGDPLPQNERERLVPVKTEGSVDEDLLEDSTRAIEEYLHIRGYRDATAPFQRDERDGELIITFTVKRGPRYLLRDLKFAGNTAIPIQQLEELVRLKNGEPFVRATLDAGVQAIKNTYRTRGFTRADVKASDLVSLPENLNDPDRGVEVTLTISEGPRSVVRTVTFQGNTVISEADLQRLTVISPGRAYVAAEMNGDPGSHRDGVPQSRPRERRGDERADVPAERHAGRRPLHRQRGPLIVVDHVIITGNRRTSTKTIERELLLHTGDPLSEQKLVESRARLADLRLFRRAQIEAVAHGSEPRRDLLVQVDESPATVLGLGGGVEGGYQVRTSPTGLAEEHFEFAPRGFFQIGRRNLFGKNRTIDLFTRVSLRSRDEIPPSDVTTPGPTPPVQSSYGFHEYRVVPTYTERASSGRDRTSRFRALSSRRFVPASTSAAASCARRPTFRRRGSTTSPASIHCRARSCSTLPIPKRSRSSIACSRRCGCRSFPRPSLARRATIRSILRWVTSAS